MRIISIGLTSYNNEHDIVACKMLNKQDADSCSIVGRTVRHHELKKLVDFYTAKSKEKRGGHFWLPVIDGRKCKVIWGRNYSEVFRFLTSHIHKGKLRKRYLRSLVKLS